jgi:hypothetical protein
MGNGHLSFIGFYKCFEILTTFGFLTQNKISLQILKRWGSAESADNKGMNCWQIDQKLRILAFALADGRPT